MISENGTPKMIIKARRQLGMSEKFWSLAALKAYEEFGKYLSVPIAAKILLTRDFDSLDQVKNALEYCNKIIADLKSTTEQRLNAIEIQTLAIEAQVKLSKQIMEMAEKSGNKPAVEKPKNLPPQIPVQINIGADKPQSVTIGAASSAAETDSGL